MRERDKKTVKVVQRKDRKRDIYIQRHRETDNQTDMDRERGRKGEREKRQKEGEIVRQRNKKTEKKER